MSGMTNDVQSALEDQLTEEQLAEINAGLSAYMGGGSDEPAEEPQREGDATFYDKDYAPLPESPGLWTKTKSSVRDIAQDVGLIDEDEKSDAQKEMEQYREAYDKNMEQRRATFEKVGRKASVDIPLVGEVELSNTRIQEGKVKNPDFNPELPEGEDNPPYIYRDMYVPDPDTNILTRMGGELLTRTAEALGDFVIDRKVLQEGTASKMLPNMPQGSGEALATEITSYLIPGLGARKAAVETVKGAEKVKDLAKSIDPEYAKKAKEAFEKARENGASITEAGNSAKKWITLGLTGTYAGLGETMIAPPEAEGWIIDGDLVSELSGLEGDDAEAVALFLESSTFGGALYGLAKAAGWVKNVAGTKIGGATRLNPKATQKMFESANTLSILKTLDPELMEGPAEIVAMRMRILAEEIGTNKVAKILGEGGPEVRLDSTNALIQSTYGYLRRAYAFKADELGEEGFEKWLDDKATSMATNMLVLRGGMGANKGVIEAEARMSQDVGIGLQGMVDEQVAEAGFGSVREGAQDTAQKLVDERTATIATAEDVIKSMDDEIARLEELKATGLINDKDLGPLLAQVEGVGSIGLTKQVTDRMRTLMGDEVYTAWKKDFDAYNDAYKNFPEGVPVDGRSIALSIKDATEELRFTDKDGAKVREMLGSIAIAFKMPKAVIKDLEGDKAEAFFAKLEERMSGPKGIDAKYVFTTFKPKLEELIKSSSGEVSRRLIALKKSIVEGQTDFLVENGSEEVADYARNADQLYKSYTNRWQPDSKLPMGQLDEAARSRAKAEARFAKEGNTDVLAQGQEEYATVAGRTIDAMEGDLKNAGFEPVIRAVKGSIDKDIQPEIAEYYATLALKSLADAIAAGNPQNIKTLTSALTAYKPKLEALNSPLVAKISSAETSLQTLEAGVARGTEVANQIRDLAMGAKEKAEQEVVVNALLSRIDPTAARFASDDAIADLFKDNLNSVDSMQSLMEKVRQLPPEESVGAIAAVKAVALRQATENVFTYSRGGITKVEEALRDESLAKLETANQASIKTASSILRNERDKTLDALRVVFADDPTTVDVYTGLLEALDALTVPNTVKFSSRGSDTQIVEQMATATDSARTAIIIAFGVLNPTATLARNLSRGITASLDEAAKQIDEDVLAMLMRDPGEIVKGAKMLADGIDPEVVRKTMEGRLAEWSYNLSRSTGVGVKQSPERTERQDAATSQASYEDYLDKQMREIIGIQ